MWAEAREREVIDMNVFARGGMGEVADDESRWRHGKRVVRGRVARPPAKGRRRYMPIARKEWRRRQVRAAHN